MENTTKYRKPRKGVFSEHFNLRLDVETLSKLKKRAKNGQSLAAVARHYLQVGLSRPKDTVEVVLEVPELTDLVKELNRVGVNLNQLVRLLHEGERTNALAKVINADGKTAVVTEESLHGWLRDFLVVHGGVTRRLEQLEKQAVVEVQKAVNNVGSADR